MAPLLHAIPLDIFLMSGFGGFVSSMITSTSELDLLCLLIFIDQMTCRGQSIDLLIVQLYAWLAPAHHRLSGVQSILYTVEKVLTMFVDNSNCSCVTVTSYSSV